MGICHVPYTLAEVSGVVFFYSFFFAFEGAKLLATLTSAVEWYKSHSHNYYYYRPVQNFYNYVTTQCELNIALFVGLLNCIIIE